MCQDTNNRLQKDAAARALTKVLERLIEQAKKWLPCKKVLRLGDVVCPSGERAGHPEEALEALHDHWSKQFEEKNIDRGVGLSFLAFGCSSPQQ